VAISLAKGGIVSLDQAVGPAPLDHVLVGFGVVFGERRCLFRSGRFGVSEDS